MTIRSLTFTFLTVPILALACSGAETPNESLDAAPGSLSAQSRQTLMSQLASAGITFEQAIDAAIAANPGSTLLCADLDGTDADLHYEIELGTADGLLIEVHVDAKTGEIVATTSEDVADGFDDEGDDGVDDEADSEAEGEECEDGAEHEGEPGDDGEDADDGEAGDEFDDDSLLECTGGISAMDALKLAETEATGMAVELWLDPEDCEFEVVVRTATGLTWVDIAPDGTITEVGSDEGYDQGFEDDYQDDDGE